MIIIICIFLETSQLRGLEPMGGQQRARTNGRPAESARTNGRPHLTMLPENSVGSSVELEGGGLITMTSQEASSKS
jgi:hypothetical protein